MYQINPHSGPADSTSETPPLTGFGVLLIKENFLVKNYCANPNISRFMYLPHLTDGTEERGSNFSFSILFFGRDSDLDLQTESPLSPNGPDSVPNAEEAARHNTTPEIGVTAPTPPSEGLPRPADAGDPDRMDAPCKTHLSHTTQVSLTTASTTTKAPGLAPALRERTMRQIWYQFISDVTPPMTL